MNNFSKSQQQQLDDQLSEFTDQVLSPVNIEPKMQETMSQDEMYELQKTVLRMKAAAQAVRANSTVNNVTHMRIRTRLLAEWKKASEAERQVPKRFVRKWSLPRIALAGGFAILIIFSAMMLLNLSTIPLTGTADGTQAWSPLFILVSIVVIILILWYDRNN